MLVEFSKMPGVNFTNIFTSSFYPAFTPVAPKCVRIQSILETESARAVQAVKSLFSPHHRKKDATPSKLVLKPVEEIGEVDKKYCIVI